ncbi:hypothetical protein B0T19DRAFT_296335 [Cercophora scortea]|uniref:Uncharacterized protein n=1 Tax=Cercophora scortea TaxID=314031 RepID=A0AAE0I3C1_9PEZI|nr:hypothetical protein B0T19DRAFT_296335 [Cercophora scortea]
MGIKCCARNQPRTTEGFEGKQASRASLVSSRRDSAARGKSFEDPLRKGGDPSVTGIEGKNAWAGPGPLRGTARNSVTAAPLLQLSTPTKRKHWAAPTNRCTDRAPGRVVFPSSLFPFLGFHQTANLQQRAHVELDALTNDHSIPGPLETTKIPCPSCHPISHHLIVVSRHSQCVQLWTTIPASMLPVIESLLKALSCLKYRSRKTNGMRASKDGEILFPHHLHSCWSQLPTPKPREPGLTVCCSVAVAGFWGSGAPRLASRKSSSVLCDSGATLVHEICQALRPCASLIRGHTEPRRLKEALSALLFRVASPALPNLGPVTQAASHGGRTTNKPAPIPSSRSHVCLYFMPQCQPSPDPPCASMIAMRGPSQCVTRTRWRAG